MTWLLSMVAAPVCAVAEPVPGIERADATPFDIDAFLGQHCLACHDGATAEGEREFESLRFPLDDESALIAADEIVDQLTLGSMPPPDSEPISPDDRTAAAQFLRDQIRVAANRLRGSNGRTQLRRLSNREYENTLRHLIGRRVDTLGLTVDFPTDSTHHGLDTIGESLITSGYLLDLYFQAADRLIELRLAKPSIEPRDWHFKDHFVQYEELRGPHQSVLKNQFLCIYEQPNTDTRQGGYGHIEDFLEGVPASGRYRIGVLVQAMHRDTHYDPKIFRINFDEPFRMAIVPGDVRKGHIHYPQTVEPVLAESIVPDDAPEWLEFDIWLEAGQTPRFIFPNGPYESRESVIKLNERYASEFTKPQKGVSRTSLLREGKLPHIRISEIKVHGPLREPDGLREEIAIFGPGGFDPNHAKTQLMAFARRAFRRPLSGTDRERLEAVYRECLASANTPRQAALDTVKWILCSPSFMFLTESTGADDQTRLVDHDLAARWSYALWAAPPDRELMRLADQGELQDPAIAKKQLERMLDDSRSSAFVAGFLDGYLGLRDIGSLPPPRERFRDYYARNFPEAMRTEAEMMFRHLIDDNAPATEWLDARYSFVDWRLAKLYELPDAESFRQADGFRRVDFDQDTPRGGVLGMAAVLTASANGVETSPVTRGVWVLEKLLGLHPPPPPDEVPSIDANVNGAKTIREKLTLHREDPACNVCHSRIDPMGFGLENFGPIGNWRRSYGGGKNAAKIDASGVMPSGESYANFAEYRDLLSRTRRDVFVEHLIETLLAYASGRRIEISDRDVVATLVERSEANGHGLRDLVIDALNSDIVRHR